MPRRTIQISDELAALDELEREIRRPPKRNLTIILPVFVTLIVAAGATTIAWYSYTTGVREGSEGAAPLLKPQGPVKVTPESPGGLAIPHQDKTVFQAMEGRRTDTKIERLLPPPELPAPLPARGPSKSRQAERLETPFDEETSSGESEARSGPVRLTPGAGGARPGGAPSTGNTRPAPMPAPKENAGDTPPIPMPTPGSKPQEMPKPTAAEKKAPAPEKKANMARIPSPPVSLKRPKSGYGIQIGSLSSKTKAGDFWDAQVKKHADILDDLSLLVQTVTVKGKTYHRIQGGALESRKAASDLCGQLKQRGVGCIVVRFGK